jgi:hypothetical protein
MVLFQFYGGTRSFWGGGMFNDFVYWLDYWGVRDIILPFILIFTIFFAVLQKIRLFGPKSRKYNVVLSLAISLLVIIPHATGLYPAETDVINIINDSIPEVALLVIVVVLVLMMLGMVAGKSVRPGAGVLNTIAAVAVVLLLLIFANSIFPMGFMSYVDPAIQSLIVILLVFGLIIYWVAGPTKSAAEGTRYWFGPGMNTPEEYKKWEEEEREAAKERD